MSLTVHGSHNVQIWLAYICECGPLSSYVIEVGKEGKQTSVQRADNLIKSQRLNCCQLLWIGGEEAMEGTTNLITKQSCDK